MDDVTRKAIVNDLEGALAMLGQAQERCQPSTELWKELGKLYDTLDSIKDAVPDPDCYA